MGQHCEMFLTVHFTLFMSSHSPNLFIEPERPLDELDVCNDKISHDKAFVRLPQHYSH